MNFLQHCVAVKVERQDPGSRCSSAPGFLWLWVKHFWRARASSAYELGGLLGSTFYEFMRKNLVGRVLWERNLSEQVSTRSPFTSSTPDSGQLMMRGTVVCIATWVPNPVNSLEIHPVPICLYGRNVFMIIQLISHSSSQELTRKSHDNRPGLGGKHIQVQSWNPGEVQ